MKIYTQFPRPMLTVVIVSNLSFLLFWALKNQHQRSGSRWWHKRILNSPLPTATANLQLRRKQPPLRKKKKNLKTAWATSTHLTEERSLWKWVEEAGPPAGGEPHPHSPERTQKPRGFFPRTECELHTKTCPWDISTPLPATPQTSSFENQRAWSPHNPQL